MRRFNQLVFDEVVGTQVGGIDVYYTTSQSLNTQLGHCDQLGLQAITDNVTGRAHGDHTGVMAWIEVRLETSCDGRHWVRKNSAAEIPLSLVSGTGQTLLPYGQDDGTRPSYAFVRFVIRFSALGPASAHLRLYVTGRDQGGVIVRAFTASQYRPVLPPAPPEVDTSKADLQKCLKRFPASYCIDLY